MWIIIPSVTTNTGSTAIAVNGGFSTASIKPGDAIILGGVMYEIGSTTATSIVLRDAYPGTSQSDVVGRIVPTAADFNGAAEVLRDVTEVTTSNFAAMEEWWTGLGTVEFIDYEGNKHTVKTVRQIELDGGTSGTPGATANEQVVTASTVLTVAPSHVVVRGAGAISIETPSSMHVNGTSFYVTVEAGAVTHVSITNGSIGNIITQRAPAGAADRRGLYLVMYQSGRWRATHMGDPML